MNKRIRWPFSTSPFEQKILAVIFLSAGIPVTIVLLFLYSMFSDLIYVYLTLERGRYFFNQFLFLSAVLLAYYFAFVGIVAYGFIHRLVGALPRVLRELDERIQGKSKSHIHVRKGDYIQKLIDRINALIDKLP